MDLPPTARALSIALLLLAAACGDDAQPAAADLAVPGDLAAHDSAAALDQAAAGDQSMRPPDQASPADLAIAVDQSLPPPDQAQPPGDGADDGRCAAAGAVPAMALCCLATGDYPNQCRLGGCSCAPGSSHMVKICVCPMGKCFNGMTCQ